MDVDQIISEVMDYIESIDVTVDGEHLWSNFEEITAISVRLQEIHNKIAIEEIRGTASTELKKVRTMLVDPSLERLDKLASFESRKLTARNLEWEMEKK